MQSGRGDKTKSDFDYHFLFLTIFLKKYNFSLTPYFSARQKDHFQQQKWTFRSDFVKLGSRILTLFLADNDRLMFVLFCWILCPIMTYFFLLIEALIKLRKILLERKLSHLWLGNCLRGGGGGGPSHFFGKIHFEPRAPQVPPSHRGNFWRRFGTSAPNRLRATPCPTIVPKIGISPSWS